MFIDIGPYKDSSISIFKLVRYFESKLGLLGDNEIVYPPKRWYQKIIMYPLYAFERLCSKINAWEMSHPRRVEIRIDKYDTWSMDHTLAMIIHPMLIQLKETKHGAPNTDDWDVPHGIKSVNAKPKVNEWDTDEFHFVRWDYIMDEMIYAFSQLKEDDWTARFYTIDGESIAVDEKGLDEEDKRIYNGLRLFGKYYRALWD